jgi:hypothetical protein
MRLAHSCLRIMGNAPPAPGIMFDLTGTACEESAGPAAETLRAGCVAFGDLDVAKSRPAYRQMQGCCRRADPPRSG